MLTQALKVFIQFPNWRRVRVTSALSELLLFRVIVMLIDLIEVESRGEVRTADTNKTLKKMSH